MQIFQQEINDGLSDQISAKASICYASQATPILHKSSAFDHASSDSKKYKALAGIDDSDLYYVQSILVTSSWNKNDDVFDSLEVWYAKQTPMHKPTNLEHDENTIIGHITSNWPITDDGVLIDENTPIENLPQKFHILTGSVIYTGYTDPALRERAQKLISEIENGTKYVSMECFFKGFDYGLINKATNEFKVLKRNEETSYLTKFLRAYGGAGEHDNYKIGRVLRDITFSGKGYVNKPANPESIIFNKETLKFGQAGFIEPEKNDIFSDNSVSNNRANLQETDMNSENQTVETTEVSSQTQSNEINVQEYVEKLAIAEEQNKKLQEALEAALKAEADSKLQIEAEMKVKCEELENSLNAANEVIAAYKAKEMEMMKKEKKMKRMATLIEAGLDNDTANSTVDKFEALDDDAFEAMSSLISTVKSTNTVASTVEVTEVQEEPAAETKAEDVSEVLESAEPVEEVNLSVGSETISEIENTRAALVDFVYSRLGKKTINKGE